MLSVIFPTRNRAQLLEQALLSLGLENYNDFEIEVLVVDNGSTDHTQSVVKMAQDRFANVRYFFEPEPGLHVGRHRGLSEANGEILVYADDDIEASPTWLTSIHAAFSDRDVAMVGGNNVPKFLGPVPNWLSRLWKLSRVRGGRALAPLSIMELEGPRRVTSPLNIWGCNFSIRKNVLLEVGGFHPDGMPRELIRFRGDGETHVSRAVQQIGLKCIFDPDASVFHKIAPGRMTIEYFRKRGYNQGISDSYTALRNENYCFDSRDRQIIQKLSSKLTRAFRKAMLWNRLSRRALIEMSLGHQEGFAYHQRSYRADAQLREWVHRPVYF